MNEKIYYIKGLAIISVISAHCNAVLDNTNRFAVYSSLLLQNIGTLGVICFFVISGMLFHYPDKNIGQFFKKKLKNIVIPWLISATCVYLYVYLRKPPVTFSGWVNFIIGNGSYCYYLTVLMIFYLLFVAIPIMRNNTILLLCEIATVASTIWFYDLGGVNPYLNIVNWIGYFALGVQLNENKELILNVKKRYHLIFCRIGVVSGISYILLLFYQLYNQKGGGYWNGVNAVTSWVGAISLTLLSITILKSKNRHLKKIIYLAGVDSFAIYIWHMPIAGIVARFMCIEPLTWFVIIRPIIVLLIMHVGIFIVRKLSRKMKIHQLASYIGLHI